MSETATTSVQPMSTDDTPIDPIEVDIPIETHPVDPDDDNDDEDAPSTPDT